MRVRTEADRVKRNAYMRKRYAEQHITVVVVGDPVTNPYPGVAAEIDALLAEAGSSATDEAKRMRQRERKRMKTYRSPYDYFPTGDMPQGVVTGARDTDASHDAVERTPGRIRQRKRRRPPTTA